jgi:hypothetical protein
MDFDFPPRLLAILDRIEEELAGRSEPVDSSVRREPLGLLAFFAYHPVNPPQPCYPVHFALHP